MWPRLNRNFPFRKIILFSVGFFMATVLQAQTYYFENYSVRQGLSNSKVYDLLQDKEGYIWLATPSGLIKFNGDNFTAFGQKYGMDESSVRALFIDDKERLWIGFESGRVFVKPGKANIFQLIISDTSSKKGEITDITQNSGGHIIITTFGAGILQVENALSENQVINQFSGKDGIDEVIYKAERTRDGSILFATSVDIIYQDADSLKFGYFRPNGFPSFFLTTCMIEDSKGNIWIGKHNGGLYRFNIDSREFRYYDMRDGLTHNFISNIFEDSRGQIWVGTWGGGVSLIRNGEIAVNFNEKNGLYGLNIQKINEDAEGNIYIATQEDGFFIFKGDQFLAMSEENGLPNMQIWDICEGGENSVFLATNNGLAEVEFSAANKARVVQVFNQSNQDIISTKIRNLASDSEGNIWIGTALSGIQSFNKKTGKFNFDYILNSNLPKNANLISDLAVVGNDLFIATVDGLLNHEINSGKTFRISQTDGLSGNDITTLFPGKTRKLWIGVRNEGINFIDHQNLITQLPKTKSITPISFSENSKGELWVGTLQGVYKLVDDSLVKVVDEQTGLLSNYVSLIHFIDDSRLIIGSNNGLNIYYPGKNEIVHYNKNVGYTGIETKNNAFLTLKNGALLFGTTGGLMIFNPKSQERKLMEPFVHITDMKVNLEPQSMAEKVKYAHNENSFLFNYHAISLSNQPDLQYQVMLEGMDLGWQMPTKSKSISFSQLDPGDYVFKVKAITFDGVVTQTPANYSFTIRPPFWKTWWFIGGSLFIILFSSVSVVRYRIYMLQKEKKILEQKVADRTKEISQKNELLAEKNKHITDSINYARRIQYATMRPEEHLNDLYRNAFILYLPKDIVSGDFYWYAQKDNYLIVAAADCTGHGVPGAFMSMLGIAFINEIVGRNTELEAHSILQQLRHNVIKALNQEEGADTTKDGMDIALLLVDFDTKTLQYSGAYNPLYLLRQGEIAEYKADRMPIGVHSRDNEPFTNHIIPLLEGDQLYIFTDGFSDQFGGDQGKKMNYTRFKSLLKEQENQLPAAQRTHLLHAFENWKGNHEQLDDVLVIGITV